MWLRGQRLCSVLLFRFDEAIHNLNDAVAAVGDVHVMSDSHHRAALAVELNEEVDDFAARFRIEITGGLVG